MQVAISAFHQQRRGAHFLTPIVPGVFDWTIQSGDLAKAREFYKTYLKALLDGEAGLFVGAGLSTPTGFVDWRGLLRETAEDLGLDVDQETDLIAVAQYHVNKHGGRSRLNQVLIDEFTKAASLTGVPRRPSSSLTTTATVLEGSWMNGWSRRQTSL